MDKAIALSKVVAITGVLFALSFSVAFADYEITGQVIRAQDWSIGEMQPAGTGAPFTQTEPFKLGNIKYKWAGLDSPFFEYDPAGKTIRGAIWNSSRVLVEETSDITLALSEADLITAGCVLQFATIYDCSSADFSAVLGETSFQISNTEYPAGDYFLGFKEGANCNNCLAGGNYPIGSGFTRISTGLQLDNGVYIDAEVLTWVDTVWNMIAGAIDNTINAFVSLFVILIVFVTTVLWPYLVGILIVLVAYRYGRKLLRT